MERLQFSPIPDKLHIDGFPDGIKVVELKDRRAIRLADLTLHQADLEFALENLEAINKIPEQDLSMRETLWRSAIVHYAKCFGVGVRGVLSPDKIYKNCAPEALEAFKYFKNLRNKHVVHDENSYTQAIPGAVLNNGAKEFKIEKIVVVYTHAQTLEQANWNNLHTLISDALSWVVREFDDLANKVTVDLEKEKYDDLIARPEITYFAPKLDEIDKARR